MTPSRGAGAAAAALATAALLAGCNDDEPASSAGGGGRLGANANLQVATCEDWRASSFRGRRITVDRLEEIVRGPNGRGRTLPDDRAYEIIDRRCKNYFARGFLLYEMYSRAAAFQSLAK